MRLVVDRHTFILGRLDPHIDTIARWADESPEAMMRLLSDPALQGQLLDALGAIGFEARKDKAEEAS